MARRLKSAAFDELVEIAARLPWWAGLALAVMAYVVLHLYAVAEVPAAKNPAQIADAAIRNAVKGFALVGQYLVPVVFLAGALASALAQRRRGRSSAQRGEPGLQEEPRLHEEPRLEAQPEVQKEPELREAPKIEAASVENGVDRPLCPRCSRAMTKRVGVHGSQAGKPFWGCPGFPDCRGTLPSD